MPSKEMIEYVRLQMAAGTSVESLRKIALQTGWTEEEFNVALALLGVEKEVIPAPLQDATNITRGTSPVQANSTPSVSPQQVVSVPPNSNPSVPGTPPKKQNILFANTFVSVRMVIYAILGFFIGTFFSFLIPILLVSPTLMLTVASLGSYGPLIPGVVCALLCALFARWLDTRFKLISPLPPFRQLFKATLVFYKTHVNVILGISLVGLGSNIPYLLCLYYGALIPPILYLLIIWITFFIGLLGFFVAYCAILQYAIAPDIYPDVVSSYKRAGRAFFPILWIEILIGLLTLGTICVSAIMFATAAGIFFLITKVLGVTIVFSLPMAMLSGTIAYLVILIVLIVVPILVSQSTYVYFSEGKTGLSALARSWMYVRHHINAYFVRVFALGLVNAVVGFLLGVLLSIAAHTLPVVLSTGVQTLVENAFVLCVSVPVTIIFGLYIFTNLQKLYAHTPEADIKERHTSELIVVFICISAIAVILVSGIAVAFRQSVTDFMRSPEFMKALHSSALSQGVATSTNNAIPHAETVNSDIGGNSLLWDAQRQTDLALLQNILQKYATRNKGSYPLTLQDLMNFQDPQNPYVGGIPTDPSTKKPYRYNIGNDQSFYSLCTSLSLRKEYCVDSNNQTMYIDDDDLVLSSTTEQVVTDPSGAFSYGYPQTWSMSTSTDGAPEVYLVTTTSTDATLGLQSDIFTADTIFSDRKIDLDTAEHEQLQGFKSESKTPLTNTSEQKIHFGKDMMYVLSFDNNLGDGIRNTVTHYIISHKGILYGLMFTSSREVAPMFRDVNQAIFFSFNFK